MSLNFNDAMGKIGTSHFSSVADFKALVQNMYTATIGANEDVISLLYSGELTNGESAREILSALSKSITARYLKTPVRLGADTNVDMLLDNTSF